MNSDTINNDIVCVLLSTQTRLFIVLMASLTQNLHIHRLLHKMEGLIYLSVGVADSTNAAIYGKMLPVKDSTSLCSPVFTTNVDVES